MSRHILQFGRVSTVGRWCSAAAVVACLCISGCTHFDLYGERFQYDPAFELGTGFRAGDAEVQPVAVTNKSIQIERNLGVR